MTARIEEIEKNLENTEKHISEQKDLIVHSHSQPVNATDCNDLKAAHDEIERLKAIIDENATQG